MRKAWARKHPSAQGAQDGARRARQNLDGTRPLRKPPRARAFVDLQEEYNILKSTLGKFKTIQNQPKPNQNRPKQSKTRQKPSKTGQDPAKTNQNHPKPSKTQPKPAKTQPKPAKTIQNRPKPTKTYPKPAKTNQNQPKPTKTDQNQPRLTDRPGGPVLCCVPTGVNGCKCSHVPRS